MENNNRDAIKAGLLDRIRRLEADLKAPLEQDSHEQAAQLSQRMITSRLLEIERENLKALEGERA